MPCFVVILHGTGIDIAMDGVTAVGFYTSRSVRAPDALSARELAVCGLEAEWRQPPLSEANRGDVPRLEVEAVRAHAWWQHILFRRRGYTFYPPGEVEAAPEIAMRS